MISKKANASEETGGQEPLHTAGRNAATVEVYVEVPQE